MNEKTNTMTVERFAALVEAYGASPARWPEAERAAAEALLETSDEARRLRDEAASLDTLLAAPATMPVSRELQDKILASMPASGAAPRNWFGTMRAGGTLGPAAALAFSLVLGVALGSMLPSMIGLDEDTLALSQAFSDAGMDAAWVGVDR